MKNYFTLNYKKLSKQFRIYPLMTPYASPEMKIMLVCGKLCGY